MQDWLQLKALIQDTLRLPDPDFLDVVMSTILCIKLDMDPVWLMIAGASGSSKTEVARIFNGSLVHHATSATASALVSGMLMKDDEGKAIENSFLKRVNGKTWIIKDFSEILNMPKEAKQKFEATLRDAFDGYVNKAFGGPMMEKGFKCKFNIIACTTSQFESRMDDEEKAWGERFMVYRPSAWDRRTMTSHVLRRAETIRGRRKMLAGEIADFVDSVEIPTKLSFKPRKLISMADLITAARSPVVRNKYRQDTVEFIPELEMPSRFAKQLLTISKTAHFLGANAQRIIKRVALGSLPRVRYHLLKAIYDRDFLRARDLEEHNIVAVSHRVAHRTLQDLALLGILDEGRERGRGRRGAPAHVYSIKPEWASSFRVLFNNQWMDDPEEED